MMTDLEEIVWNFSFLGVWRPILVFSIFWQIQRGDPSMSKKFSSRILLKFHVANSHAIRVLIFEFHQNQRQILFYIEGSLLWKKWFLKKQRGDPSISKKFSSPILLKFHVSNPQAIGISNFEFHQNRRRKFFWHRRVPPLKKNIVKKP